LKKDEFAIKFDNELRKQEFAVKFDNELKKEEFAIKFDNGYLCYENELQMISEKELIHKLLFVFHDQVEEHDEEIVAAFKGTNKF